MSDPIRTLSDLLARLPGVGKRTALRLTFHLLSAPQEYSLRLGQEISTIRDRVKPCSICKNMSDQDPCSICSDGKRDGSIICVVANVPDLWAIEESGSYRGLYHVLHGLIAPLDGKGPEDLPLELLNERVVNTQVKEVIIATRPSVEGEATALFIRQMLEGKAEVTRIASGIPHGGELEYADSVTLGRAFEGRRGM